MSLAALLTSLAACGIDDWAPGETDAFSVSDSAGILIVESTEPEWAEPSEWSVSSEPLLEIGGLDETLGGSFAGIRGVLLRPDGTIIVADRGTTELRFFDLSGDLARRVGRQGDGPGEFRSIGALHDYRGDSLAVWDDQRRSWTILDAEGVFGRMVRPEVPIGNPRSLGAFGDGSFLIANMELRSPGGAPGTATMDVDHYLRVTSNGVLADSLGEFPNQRRFVPVQGVQALFGEVFGPRGVAWASTDGFWFGIGSANEVRFYDASGDLARVVRWAGLRAPVTDEDLERYRTERIERDGGPDPQLLAEALRGAPATSQFPAFESMIVDSVDRIWLAEFRRPTDREDRYWTVLDPAGRWLGRVALPRDFDVLWIEGSQMAGVARDDLDVEYVRVYLITEPS